MVFFHKLSILLSQIDSRNIVSKPQSELMLATVFKITIERLLLTSTILGTGTSFSKFSTFFMVSRTKWEIILFLHIVTSRSCRLFENEDIRSSCGPWNAQHPLLALHFKGIQLGFFSFFFWYPYQKYFRILR